MRRPLFLCAASGHAQTMKIAIVATLLLLASCGAPSDQKVAGVSQSEADALNDAAEMLDANAVVPVPVENVATNGNGAE